MKERKKENFIIPPVLEGQVLTQKIALLAGLTGTDQERTSFPDEEMGLDLHTKVFLENVNGSGKLLPFQLEFYHGVSSCWSDCWISEKWGRFYLDSPRAFFLVNHSTRPDGTDFLAVAGISFIIVGLDTANKRDYPGMKFDGLLKGDVLVSQIQVQKNTPPDGVQALNKIHWERKLLSLVVDWADYCYLPRVAVVPAISNRWLYDLYLSDLERQEKLKAFELRYNGTAKHCGFKRCQEGSPYLRSTNKKEIFDALFPL